MNETLISWTNYSWNVWSGCKKVSPGCKFCYAENIAENKRGTKAFPNGFDLTYRFHKLYEPLTIKKSSLIFVNSMSDLYLEEVPLENIKKVFEVMNKAYWHKFQILTKRSKRLLEISSQLIWTDNIWQGVSVENQDYINRIDDLIQVPAKIKFISAEPLIGELDLEKYKDKLNWIIVGGESQISGKYRKMDLDWARKIRNLCIENNIPFFFKQKNYYKSEYDPILDGEKWQQFPS